MKLIGATKKFLKEYHKVNELGVQLLISLEVFHNLIFNGIHAKDNGKSNRMITSNNKVIPRDQKYPQYKNYEY